jgi:hypothetical protein
MGIEWSDSEKHAASSSELLDKKDGKNNTIKVERILVKNSVLNERSQKFF